MNTSTETDELKQAIRFVITKEKELEERFKIATAMIKENAKKGEEAFEREKRKIEKEEQKKQIESNRNSIFKFFEDFKIPNNRLLKLINDSDYYYLSEMDLWEDYTYEISPSGKGDKLPYYLKAVKIVDAKKEDKTPFYLKERILLLDLFERPIQVFASRWTHFEDDYQDMAQEFRLIPFEPKYIHYEINNKANFLTYSQRTWRNKAIDLKREEQAAKRIRGRRVVSFEKIFSSLLGGGTLLGDEKAIRGIDNYEATEFIDDDTADKISDENDIKSPVFGQTTSQVDLNIENRNNLLKIYKAIKGLKKIYRKAITYHYINDLSVKETANQLHKSYSATNKIISRAVKKIKLKVA